jgi:hypothetical protein
MRDRDDSHFKVWAQDRTKSRLCDYCKDGIKDHNVMLHEEKERVEKRKVKSERLTLAQINYSKSDLAKSKRETRRKIEDYHDMQQYQSQYGDE